MTRRLLGPKPFFSDRLINTNAPTSASKPNAEMIPKGMIGVMSTIKIKSILSRLGFSVYCHLADLYTWPMKELDIAKHAAKTAGELLLKHFSTELEVEYKSDKDLVTLADTEAQNEIIRIIKAEFPDDDFFAEESEHHEYSAGRQWVIDPLDGTINFSRGIPLFGVSIAFVDNGERRCGVIYLPFYDEMYSAKKGGGAFLNDKPISVASTEVAAKSIIAVNDFNIGPHNKVRNINLLKRNMIERTHAKCMRMKNLGSASVELAYVASGKFDAYLVLFTYYWDIAAGTLIVEEAGGKVTDYEGKAIGFDPKCIVISNGKVHGEYLNAINKENNSLQARFESLIKV